MGDCGPKLGMQGIDNGWCKFNNVEIPYDNLLDKFSQIDLDGKFQSLIKNNNERFALTLSALSTGWLLVCLSSSRAATLATCIGIWYLNARK